MDFRQFEVLQRQVESLAFSSEKTIIDLRQKLKIKLERWQSPYKTHKHIEFSSVDWAHFDYVLIFYNKYNILEISLYEGEDDSFDFIFHEEELKTFESRYVLEPELIQVPALYLEPLFNSLGKLRITIPVKKFYSVYITPRKLFGYFEKDDVYPIWGLRQKGTLDKLCQVDELVQKIATQGSLIVAQPFDSDLYYDLRFHYRFLNHYVMNKEGKTLEGLFKYSMPTAVYYNNQLYWKITAYLEEEAILKSADHEDVSLEPGWYAFLHPEPDAD